MFSVMKPRHSDGSSPLLPAPDKQMSPPDYFELADGYACYRPVGTVTLDQGGELITAAIVYCRENRIANLLVNITALTGFAPPQTLDRYRLMEKFAFAAQGKVRAVMVAPPEMIDPHRFGITVARNRGLDSNVFTNE